MLIRFSVENFLSFDDEAGISMVKGRSRLHPSHVVKAQSRNDLNILRGATIYGANASGKSNLIKAIQFGQSIIKKSADIKRGFPIQPFKLSSKPDRPSKFQYDFKNKGKIYSYGFSLDRKRILEEWLYESGKYREDLLFSRVTGEGDNADVNINFKKLDINRKEKRHLVYTAMGTKPNQLFLTETVDRNISHYRDAYDWFHGVLNIVFPDTEMLNTGYILDLNAIYEAKTDLLSRLLSTLGTGIDDVRTQIRKITDTEIPDEVVNDILSDLDDGSVTALRGPQKQRYEVYKDKDGEVKAARMYTLHKKRGNNEGVLFDLSEESDGTRRIFDLLPILMNNFLLEKTKNKVYIIDEIDRSLHPHITAAFLKIFLNDAFKDANTQLIVTTHESSLLNLDIFRRDEIWFTEKNKNFASELYSLEEFKPRYDKDIETGYLKGRFGAIPFVRSLKKMM